MAKGLGKFKDGAQAGKALVEAGAALVQGDVDKATGKAMDATVDAVQTIAPGAKKVEKALDKGLNAYVEHKKSTGALPENAPPPPKARTLSQQGLGMAGEWVADKIFDATHPRDAQKCRTADDHTRREGSRAEATVCRCRRRPATNRRRRRLTRFDHGGRKRPRAAG
jgi:hypothetical protein